MLEKIDKPKIYSINGKAPIAPLAIEVANLHKSYPGKKAENGVSFSVYKGEIFGILGPNGAGKSTTLEIIEGMREPDKAPNTLVLVDGLDVRDSRQRDELHQRIGLQLQTSTLFDELTVKENLDMLASLYRQARPVKELLEEFDLVSKASARLGTLSGGQKQRVALAAALINDPTLIFLDEPTTALDPQARRNVWSSIQKLQAAGKTVVLTTHYMEEAETLCNRLAIMDNGEIIAMDTPTQLIQQYARSQTVICAFASDILPAQSLSVIPGVVKVSKEGEEFTLQTTDLTKTLVNLLQFSERQYLPLKRLTTRSSSLEDVFISLTGKELRD